MIERDISKGNLEITQTLSKKRVSTSSSIIIDKIGVAGTQVEPLELELIVKLFQLSENVIKKEKMKTPTKM